MNPLPGIVLFVIVAAAVALVLARRAKGDAERRLRRLAGDDAAERLIRFEQSRAPELSRPDAARRAVDRLLADRTR